MTQWIRDIQGFSISGSLSSSFYGQNNNNSKDDNNDNDGYFLDDNDDTDNQNECPDPNYDFSN